MDRNPHIHQLIGQGSYDLGYRYGGSDVLAEINVLHGAHLDLVLLGNVYDIVDDSTYPILQSRLAIRLDHSKRNRPDATVAIFNDAPAC